MLRGCAPGLGLLTGLLLLYPAPLRAQHDSTMMKHDSAMMMHHGAMGHADSGMMESGMMKKDGNAMEHQAMAPNMMFMGAAGHRAAGDYEIVRVKGTRQIKLTPDFAVDEGSDLYLVLASSTTPDAQSLYLGKLKSAKGSQSYDIPKGTDLSQYTRLLVWSRKSNSLVASAELSASGHMMRK
jgi:hypothetical protein